MRSYAIPSTSVTTGENAEHVGYPDSRYVRCGNCGYIAHLDRDRRAPDGSRAGEGNERPSTELAVHRNAGNETLTVDSTSGFPTPATGSITAFASAGRVGTTVTSAAHGIKGGVVTIISTTNYDGTFNIQDVKTDSYVIPVTYVADDATGTWTQPESFTIHDVNPSSTIYNSVKMSTDGYLTIPNHADFTIAASADFTFDFFFKLDKLEDVTFFSTTNSGASKAGYHCSLTSTGYLRWRVTTGGGSWDVTTVQNLSTFHANRWYHIALVRSSDTTTMYINGVAQSTTGTNADEYATSEIFHVSSLNGVQWYVPGKIANFRFVNGTAKYTAGFDVPTAYHTSDANTKVLITDSIADTSSLKHTITQNGTVSLAQSGPADARIQKTTHVTYTGLTSTTFTGCVGTGNHEINDVVRGEVRATGGCPYCGCLLYDQL